MSKSYNRSRLDRLARAAADRYAIKHPGVASAWGIAYDAFIEGLGAVTGANGMLPEELREEAIRMLRGKYTPRFISTELGVDVQAIHKLYRELNPSKRGRPPKGLQ